jgi:hypothetical protein
MNPKFDFESPRLRNALTLLTSTISSDDALRKWFLSLENLSSNLRANAILQITTEMRHGGEDMELIGAIAALSNPELYTALKETLQELD